MANFEFDFSEITKLVADLEDAPDIAAEDIAKALHVTAGKVRDDWRESWEGSEHVPAGAASITYDLQGVASALLGRSVMEAEIGPEIGRAAGPLVGMLEYGTPTTGPRGYGAEALRKNEADFIEGIQKAAGDAF